MPSRFGRQPVYDELARQNFHATDAAAAIGCTYPILYTTITGQNYPKPEICEALSRLLRKPIAELFTADALAARPRKSGPRPKIVGVR